MALVQIAYCSSSRLACSSCLPADVILCVPAEFVAPHICPEGVYEQTYQYRHIEASLVAVTKSVDCAFNTLYRYTFEFDDDQLVADSGFLSSDVTGVFCKGCLTNWIEDLVGNEIEIDVGDYEVTITSQHGCATTFTAGLEPLEVTDTESVDLTITAAPNQNLSADVNISADTGNIIEIRPDGLFAESSGGYSVLYSKFCPVLTNIPDTTPVSVFSHSIAANTFSSCGTRIDIEIRAYVEFLGGETFCEFNVDINGVATVFSTIVDAAVQGTATNVTLQGSIVVANDTLVGCDGQVLMSTRGTWFKNGSLPTGSRFEDESYFNFLQTIANPLDIEVSVFSSAGAGSTNLYLNSVTIDLLGPAATCDTNTDCECDDSFV